MKLTALTLAATLVASAAAADTNTFADCVVDVIIEESGLTADLAQTYLSGMMQEAKGSLSEMAEKYLALPEGNKPAATIMMWTQIPQSQSCTHILDQ